MQRDYYEKYGQLEREHWWFRARLRILRKYLEKIDLNQQNQTRILNIGPATGLTSKMLEKFGKVTSLEYDEYCCQYIREGLGIEVIQGSITHLPFKDNSFDLVCAFDVIEHVEDDQKAISEIFRVLAPSGQTLLTVPAYQLLWSAHDEVNQHFRRYARSKFNELCYSKFKKVRSTYFNFFLFVPIAFVRVLKKVSGLKSKENQIKSDFESYPQSSLVNRILYFIFSTELFLIGRVNFPFGLSILYHGKKNKS